MLTSDYPWFKCRFDEFNVAQQAAVPWLDKDCNLVIAFNTAVGKTALAECAFGYHLQNSADSKVVYISPFKAISSERFRDWNSDPQLAKHRILLSTGDTAPKHGDFMDSRVLILTSKSLDSKTRNTINDGWLGEVVCFVFDEAHMISTPRRGACVESVLMRVTARNPAARIVLLSATMSNALDIAKWVKSLNGKATKCIQSDWRPVKIEYKFHEYDDDKKWDDSEKIGIVVKVVRESPSEKILVFVHSKRTGKMVVDGLRKAGIVSAFHNASLSPGKREKIERAFGDAYSGLNVLVSTSTLSSGINL